MALQRTTVACRKLNFVTLITATAAGSVAREARYLPSGVAT